MEEGFDGCLKANCLRGVKGRGTPRILMIMEAVFLWTVLSSIAVFPACGQGSIELEEALTIDGTSSGLRFQNPSDIAYDGTRDEILMADVDAGRVYIFDRHGELSGALGRSGELRLPYAVAVARDGTIYVAEKGSHAIKIFRGEKGRIGGAPDRWDLPGKVGNEVASADKLAVDSRGDLWVVDGSNGLVFVFDHAGSLRYRLGARGRGSGGFRSLRDLSIDPRGLVYTVSGGMDPLRVFDIGGNPLYSVGGDDENGEGGGDPVCTAVDNRDRLWVLDGVEGCLRVYGPTGLLLQTITKDQVPGGLFLPVDMETDEFGDLLVLERGAGRVRVFSQVR